MLCRHQINFFRLRCTLRSSRVREKPRLKGCRKKKFDTATGLGSRKNALAIHPWGCSPLLIGRTIFSEFHGNALCPYGNSVRLKIIFFQSPSVRVLSFCQTGQLRKIIIPTGKIFYRLQFFIFDLLVYGLRVFMRCKDTFFLILLHVVKNGRQLSWGSTYSSVVGWIIIPFFHVNMMSTYRKMQSPFISVQYSSKTSVTNSYKHVVVRYYDHNWCAIVLSTIHVYNKCNNTTYCPRGFSTPANSRVLQFFP